MNLKSLKLANMGFEYMDVYLSMCEYALEGRSLTLSCSKAVEEELLTRLDALRLKFDRVERIAINGVVVFEDVLPELSEDLGIKVVQIAKPSKELLGAKFPLISMRR